MFEVRIHGRGGQGVVTAAELLSVAAFLDGRYAQAFPSFGSERMGAPVVAFCRIADEPIRTHDPVAEPDAIVVQDATLLHELDLFAGLKPGGQVLINTNHPTDLPFRVATIAATEVAQRLVGRPVPNTVLLGALAALTGIVSQDAVRRAIERRFTGPVAEANVRAAQEAADTVKEAARA